MFQINHDDYIITNSRYAYKVNKDDKVIGKHPNYDVIITFIAQKMIDDNYYPAVYHIYDGCIDKISLNIQSMNGVVVKVTPKITRSVR